MGNFRSARGTKDNAKVFNLNIWIDKFPIYETGGNCGRAGLQWELEFDLGVLSVFLNSRGDMNR